MTDAQLRDQKIKARSYAQTMVRHIKKDRWHHDAVRELFWRLGDHFCLQCGRKVRTDGALCECMEGGR